jgi:hypothetical protein
MRRLHRVFIILLVLCVGLPFLTRQGLNSISLAQAQTVGAPVNSIVRVSPVTNTQDGKPKVTLTLKLNPMPMKNFAGENARFVVKMLGAATPDVPYETLAALFALPNPGCSTTIPTGGKVYCIAELPNPDRNTGEISLDYIFNSTFAGDRYIYAVVHNDANHSASYLWAPYTKNSAWSAPIHSGPIHTGSTTCETYVQPEHWKGEYFNNMALSGPPLMVRDDGDGFLAFDWGAGGPSSFCGIGVDRFSARWTRTVNFSPGNYRFTVTADDGARLYIDDQLTLDKWMDQAPTTYTTGPIYLSGSHLLRMEYYEDGGGAVAELSWEGDSGPTLPVRVPVLQLAYFPRDPNNPQNIDPVETGWPGYTVAQMQTATQGMVNAAIPIISEATSFRGYKNPSAPRYLEYYVIDSREFFERMPRGYCLGINDNTHQPHYRPHYGQILRDMNICNYVDNLGVKEVWIYGYHSNYIVPDESKMSSRYGDISNALPKDEYIPEEYRLPRCQNSYVMYNFTYQPGGAGTIGNTIHNRLHQIENVIFYAENRGYPVNAYNARGTIFWDDFSVYGDAAAASGYRSSCGNTHCPPNVINEGYNYTSRQYRENNCETWHPDNSQTTYVNANCEQWGCTDVGFYKWFMQNVPGYNNGMVYQGKQMRNWWEAMRDFNRFIDEGRSLWAPVE